VRVLLKSFYIMSIGQFPESPRLSRFPNLPDMSPKKVSATRNIYVSPLRLSKVCTKEDSLNSEVCLFSGFNHG
jgi:hypothetical protein